VEDEVIRHLSAFGPTAGEPPELDFDMLQCDGVAKEPWISRWEFRRDGKRIRICVLVDHGGRTRTLDVREWIETLHALPAESFSRLYIEEREDGEA
jgi:hypothetical protein